MSLTEEDPENKILITKKMNINNDAMSRSLKIT